MRQIFELQEYQQDVMPRLTNVDFRVAAMNAAKISMSILRFGEPGFHGVFNSTLATLAVASVNNEVSRINRHGNYAS